MGDQKKSNNETTSKPMCPNLGRRRFLKGIGTGAVASVLAPAILPLAGCDGGGSSSGGCDGGTTGVTELTVPAPPTGQATVSIARKTSIEETVRAAVTLAGGLGEIQSGHTVVLKPNITSAGTGEYGARIHTSPEVIRAVIRMVKERTAARNITVADASAFGEDTQGHAEDMGLMDVVRAEGVNFVGWQAGPYSQVRCRSLDYLTWDFRVPTSIAQGQFNHFINMPILKNHEMVPGSNVQFTCCMKNHVGVLHPTDRTTGGGRGIHTRNLGEIVAELSLAVPVHTMNVVDALSIILTGGPSSSPDHVEPGLILASKDRVAADSLAVAVLRYYAKQQNISRPYVNTSVWAQASITQAQKLNLGRSKQNIVVADDGVTNISGILSNWA
jgi:uncharacterized protein (DUF362 family)